MNEKLKHLLLCLVGFPVMGLVMLMCGADLTLSIISGTAVTVAMLWGFCFGLWALRPKKPQARQSAMSRRRMIIFYCPIIGPIIGLLMFFANYEGLAIITGLIAVSLSFVGRALALAAGKDSSEPHPSN